MAGFDIVDTRFNLDNVSFKYSRTVFNLTMTLSAGSEVTKDLMTL